MASFAIIYKPQAVLSEILIIEADYYDINSGFFRFYKTNVDSMAPEEICSHSCDEISSCTIQFEYTEEEVLEQIEKYKGEVK